MSAVSAIVGSPAEDLTLLFCDIRKNSLLLCAPLEIEDYVVQSMPDASPAKWHLAHTTWFFEHFVLKSYVSNFKPFSSQYEYLFNSYYETIGVMHPRPQRGSLTRPTVGEVVKYRHHVDEQIQNLIYSQPDDAELQALITLGLHHEQQHQELLLTDIKHAFSLNPLLPAYQKRNAKTDETRAAPELRFVPFDGGIKAVGATGDEFCFDNETPRHRALIEPFSLANRLVTNSEYIAFVRTGGYRRAEFWLAEGWRAVNTENWARPIYWQESLDSEFTLHGVQALNLDAPVSHLSYYEADAFARWAGMRLPTEFEWEVAAAHAPVRGNLLRSGNLHPVPAVSPSSALTQLFGDVWEWTASSYSPYPGYAAEPGALGEYNAKFMCSQMVLRGGSCVSPDEHIRATYRNFFAASARWQFSGIRLAR
jgi:ergothioneine biosynthesis protein EgtB